jgi:CBS domain-containing protein
LAQKLRDMMNTHLQCCIAEDNIYEAALKMETWNVGAIPVVSNDQLIGMITDRDIVIRGVAQRKPNSSKITEVMSDELITASPNMSIEEAADLMAKHQIRRLPVVEGSKLVGIVSLGDLAIRDQYDHEAEEALSEISEVREGTQPPPGQ